MNFLEERIMKDGIVKPGNVLKVDSFLTLNYTLSTLNSLFEEVTPHEVISRWWRRP